MTCPRCDGISIFRALGEEPPIGAGRWMKCMSCGHRWDAEPPPPRQKEALPPNERTPMGRGPWTDEQRAKHAATIAARKAAKSGTELVPLTTRTTRAVHVKVVNGSTLGQIDEEIARREEELDALRKTREILEGAR